MATKEDHWRRASELEDQFESEFADQFTSALWSAGVEAVTIDYDGGNDESFCSVRFNDELLNKIIPHVKFPQELVDATLAYRKETSLRSTEPTEDEIRKELIQSMSVEWSENVGGREYAHEVEYGPGGSGSVQYDTRRNRFFDNHCSHEPYTEEDY